MDIRFRYTYPILLILLIVVLATACGSDTNPPKAKSIDVATATSTSATAPSGPAPTNTTVPLEEATPFPTPTSGSQAEGDSNIIEVLEIFDNSSLGSIVDGRQLVDTITSSDDGWVLLGIESGSGGWLFVDSTDVEIDTKVTLKSIEVAGFAQAVSVNFSARISPPIVIVFEKKLGEAIWYRSDAESDWIPIGTYIAGDWVYAYSPTASHFAVGDAPTSSVTSIEPRKCYIIGITGWNPGDVLPDTWETFEEKERINNSSGTWALVSQLVNDLGTAAKFGRMFRHHEVAQVVLYTKARTAEGYNVVLVGHSAGGAAAITTAFATQVAAIIQLDTYNSNPPVFPWVYSDWKTSPPVAINWNFYQRIDVPYRGRKDPGAINHRVEIFHKDVDDYVAANFASEIADSLKSVCIDTSPTATPTSTNTPKPRVPTATNTPVPRPPTATNTPRPTATNTPRPTATNTPRPTPTNTPVSVVRYTLTANLDRFTYAPGDPLTLCYRLSPENVPFNLHVNVSIDGGSFRNVAIIGDNGIGGGDCLGFTMGEPGQRRYILYADVGFNGTIDAEAEIFAEVLAPGGGSGGVLLCEHPGFAGRCIEVTGNIPDLNVLGFNDVVSSIFIPNDLAVCVYLYEHTQYTGGSRRFGRSDAGNYFVLSEFNDVTSSVQVLNGFCPVT